MLWEDIYMVCEGLETPLHGEHSSHGASLVHGLPASMQDVVRLNIPDR